MINLVALMLIGVYGLDAGTIDWGDCGWSKSSVQYGEIACGNNDRVPLIFCGSADRKRCEYGRYWRRMQCCSFVEPTTWVGPVVKKKVYYGQAECPPNMIMRSYCWGDSLGRCAPDSYGDDYLIITCQESSRIRIGECQWLYGNFNDRYKDLICHMFGIGPIITGVCTSKYESMSRCSPGHQSVRCCKLSFV